MDAPKRIWAWPHFDGWITGDWSANTYHDERTVAYILATEHERIMAEARNMALEEVALYIEQRDGSIPCRQEIASAIRAMKD